MTPPAELTGESILEISCGAHSLLYEKKKDQWKLFIGIDIDMGLLRQAKKQGLEAVCADAFHLPFRSKSVQDVYVQCSTALLLGGEPGEAFNNSDCERFCEFLAGTDFENIVLDPLCALMEETRRVCYDYLTILPSCNPEMNRFLVNAVKHLPGVMVDVDYKKEWHGKKNACVMYLELRCR